MVRCVMSKEHDKYKQVRIDPDNLKVLQRVVVTDPAKWSLAQLVNQIVREWTRRPQKP